MQPVAGVGVVLFDAVGTLIYPDPPVTEAYCAAGRRFGSRRTAAEIDGRFRQALRQLSTLTALDDHATSEQQERARWRNIVAAVLDDAPRENADRLFEELWKHFADSRNWAVFDDVAPVWRLLQQRGVQFGIASNFDARLVSLCAKLAPLNTLQEWFVFTSSRVGWAKPGGRFYRSIATQLGVPGEQILLVGDDLANDVQAARAAGWHAVQIDRERSTAESLARLTEIADLLA